MADERALDDKEKEESTRDGASNQRSHHDDMLGHILEDISLDEWDVVDEQEDLQKSSPVNELQVAKTAPTVTPPITESKPKPAAESASLFSFALMQQFEDDSEELTAPILKTEVALPEPKTVVAAPQPEPALAQPESRAELIPEPPKALGPNPFLVPPVGQTTTTPATDTQTTPNPFTNLVTNPTPVTSPAPESNQVSGTANQTTPPSPTGKAALPNTAPTEKGKRRPAATLIFDSFTKSQVGLDLLDLSNLSKAQSASTATTQTGSHVSNAKSVSTQDSASTQSTQPSKPRPTARTLIFRKGDSVDGLDPTFEQLMPNGMDRATTTGSNPAIGQHPTTGTGSNPAIGPNQTTTTGTNPTVTPNSSVGPNLAAAIAAANPLGLENPNDSAVARHNSNVIPAHQPNPGGRQIARTMILKSLAPPPQHEYVEPVDEPLLEEPLTQPGQHSVSHLASNGPEAEANALEAKPKIAKRSTSPTLVFKAFTMPSVEADSKPKPLKIIRYDSSKLRNMESNAKPLSIADSIAAAKQASLAAAEDKEDRRPLWLKALAAHPLAKSPMIRSGLLLVVLSIALLFCSSTLIKSLYSEREDLHTSTVSAVGDQHHYRSVDGAKRLSISDKDTIYSQNGKAIHGKIKGVSDSDLASLAMTPPAKREIWLQRTDAGYIDQDGTILYGAGAPELQIAKKIDTYASLVAARFKESKVYPSDAERLEHISPKDFRYTNPFTGKADQPIVQYKRFAAADASWTDHTRQAHAWADEPPWKPGAIHCVCLDYCRFFIRGFDRNGQPLFSSTPGVADYVELKDGNNMNPHRNDKIVDDKDRTPATFLVSRSGSLPFTVGVLRQVLPLLPILLIVIVLACAAIVVFLRRMRRSTADTVTNSTKFDMKK